MNAAYDYVTVGAGAGGAQRRQNGPSRGLSNTIYKLISIV
jgi:hypothetical protein